MDGHAHGHALCTICMNILCVGKSLATTYLVHMIDNHWDLMERIRATTDDNDARLALVRDLFKESSNTLPGNN